LKTLIFGSKGMVGSSVSKILEQDSGYELILSNREKTDLFNLDETKKLIEDIKPNVVINAAAKVGGIYANNTQRFSFIVDNLKINMNILESCKPFSEIKIINLGSSCIYPLNAPNPITEEQFMNGKLEPTNSPYAMAKLSSIEIGNSMTKEFGHEIINLMPTNLYGPHDYFSDSNSHVIPGLMQRMHKAKIKDEQEFFIWGSGNPLREFLHVDDLARAIKKVIEVKTNESLINVGSSKEISIKKLAESLKNVIGYKGLLGFDKSKPDGNPRKLLDSTKILDLGWRPEVGLNQGLVDTYEWFTENIAL
jgi:GDP-L-fucose synthase